MRCTDMLTALAIGAQRIFFKLSKRVLGRRLKRQRGVRRVCQAPSGGAASSRIGDTTGAACSRRISAKLDFEVLLH